MSAKTSRLLATLSRHYRVDRGKGFSLKHYDPDDTRGLDGEAPGAVAARQRRTA